MTRTKLFQPIAHGDAKTGRVSTPITQMAITGSDAALVPLQVLGATSQSEHLQNWGTALGAVLAYVDSAGNASFPSLTLTTSITLPDHSLALSKLTQGAANSILANATGSTADWAAVAIGTNTVLGRVAGNVVAAQLVAAQVADGTLTYVKLQNTSTACLLGDHVGGGTFEEVTLNATLSFSGSTLQRAALTGDVTASAGSNATTLAAGSASVLNSGTLLAARMPALTGDVTSSAGSVATTLAAGNAGNLNSGTLLAARMPAHTGDVTSSAGSVALTLAAGSASVLNSGTLLAARMPALTGDVTSSAGAVATTLAKGNAGNLDSGTLLAARMPALTGDVTTSAGAVATTIASGAVTYAKIQSASAASILAATTGGAAFGEVTLNATLEFSGSTIRRAALTGDVTASAGSNATTLAAGSAGALNSGTLLAARMPALTGDVTTVAGAVATTLAAGNAGNLNSGTLLAARMPALTGDITTSAGAVATTIGSNKVAVGMLAQLAKTSILANATSGTANVAALSATTDGDLLRQDGTTLSFGKAKIASFSTGPGILTLATLDNAAALTVTCRSANSAGARGDVALATNGILQNQASVLVSTTAPINLDLSATGNDLGGASGAKGRNAAPIIGRRDDSGSTGISAEGVDFGDVYDQTCMMTMPQACKFVKFSVNVQHGNGTNPGNWRLVVLNDTASTNATYSSIDMSHVSYANNVTTGVLSSDLTFAAGDRMWAYIDANGSANLSGCKLSIQLTPVTT